MSKHLFLITVGPVQEFIAAARRARDLWAGSQLLSELSRAAAEALHQHGATLIFPAQANLSKHEVVNRIIAELPDGADPGTVGEEVVKKLKRQIATTAETTFDTIPGLKHSPLRPAAEAQAIDLIEIFWASVSRTVNYQQDREDLEAALAARKNTREFAQPTWSDTVPKSSIDGVRESVIDENEYARSGTSEQQRREVAEKLFRSYGAGRAERLSGVDLLKRHYRPRADLADFPSTSHFAALPLLWRCYYAGGELRRGLATYLDTLRGLAYPVDTLQLDKRFKQLVSIYNYDASLLFASRLEEELEGDQLQKARIALDSYRRKALDGADPEPYYALLHADGDFMGKTIDELAIKGEQEHRRFSQELDRFADGVRSIVESEQHLGALVYSGGDDVLAFLPIHTVLECAKALADRFRSQLEQFQTDEGITPTLSVGIAICHHLEPLNDALNLVRVAEKQAKQVPGKNGLAITLSKRGSGERTISGSWSSLLYQRLKAFTEAHQTEAMPDGAAYDLLNLEERLGGAGAVLHEPMRREALRILGRKRGHRGETTIPPVMLDLVRTALGLPTETAGAPQEDERFHRTVGQIADELVLTREFARALGFKPRHVKGA